MTSHIKNFEIGETVFAYTKIPGRSSVRVRNATVLSKSTKPGHWSVRVIGSNNIQCLHEDDLDPIVIETPQRKKVVDYV